MIKNLKKLLVVVMVLAFACLTLTGCALTGTGTEGSSTSGFPSIIMLVVLIAVFYLFVIRPESKKKKKAQQMRDEITVGDKITTIGGIVGKIVEINGELITFETGEDRVRIQTTKWAISTNGVEKEKTQ